ncbi:hypothetical protein GJW-30_1_03412 [Variibacter gotjawalensis]|uniref:Preprotein translocase subunit SecD n=1 Tax=Variibacter gotjawalensis TaxID=1333996 RepID=A0A0S3PY98_9BRAD|nr:hypothetical protein [Variibacter gotjawalensis]NIK46697.1 hypothetical protein [Variibacter gotjawalensis]RZS48600.1 hypothetical protein EV661_1015 [Variibacter gotjawalensis]BAT60862.1 hypothetical protein GJW-30_1_03412 [Variibacter gotjawalensis]
MRRTALVLAGLLLAMIGAPAQAQMGPKAVFIDLVADGSIRPQLFQCVRRSVAEAGDVSFVNEDDPSKTSTVSIRAIPTYSGRTLTGYVASVTVTSNMPAAMREQLTQQMQGDDRLRMLSELRRYGATEMARIMVAPRNLNKFCDDVAAEVVTGLFDTSGRAAEPARPRR